MFRAVSRFGFLTPLSVAVGLLLVVLTTLVLQRLNLLQSVLIANAMGSGLPTAAFGQSKILLIKRKNAMFAALLFLDLSDLGY